MSLFPPQPDADGNCPHCRMPMVSDSDSAASRAAAPPPPPEGIDALKPCPFCGCEASPFDTQEDTAFRFEAGCWACYAWVRGTSPVKAAAAWNRRAGASS